MKNNAYAIIMAGGRGERFWPLSTMARPKQILTLFSGKPMLAMAVDYLRDLVPLDRIFVITSADLADAAANAVCDVPRRNIIGEPVGRDTAAVCALGAALVGARDKNGVFCVLTADHIINDIKLFQATLREGFEIASGNDLLLTIGIRPTSPNTGFGYVEAGEPFEHSGEIKFRKAIRFVEKPDLKTAERYVESGDFFWNSGMFIWSARSLLAALKKHRPQLYEMAERLAPKADAPDFSARLSEEYGKLERISIDYAIMEKAANIVMAQGEFGWDDVGTWASLEKHFAPDACGNVAIGSSESVDSMSNVIVSNDRLTALIGVKDLIIVQAANVTLVCAKERAQDVKKIVQLLENKAKYKSLL